MMLAYIRAASSRNALRPQRPSSRALLHLGVARRYSSAAHVHPVQGHTISSTGGGGGVINLHDQLVRSAQLLPARVPSAAAITSASSSPSSSLATWRFPSWLRADMEAVAHDASAVSELRLLHCLRGALEHAEPLAAFDAYFALVLHKNGSVFVTPHDLAMLVVSLAPLWPQRAAVLVEHMHARGFSIPDSVQEITVAALCRNLELQRAMCLLQWNPSSSPSSSSSTSSNKSESHVAKNIKGNDTQSTAKHSYLDSNNSRKISMRKMYHHILRAHVEMKDRDGALLVFAAMNNDNVRPDLTTYSLLIELCAREGDLNGMKQLRRAAQLDRLTPDSAYYSALLKSYGQVRWARGVDELWQEIQTRGLVIDAVLAAALIEAYGNLSRLSQAINMYNSWVQRVERDHLDRMGSSPSPSSSSSSSTASISTSLPLTITYSELDLVRAALIHACGQNNDIEGLLLLAQHAGQIAKEIAASGLKNDFVISLDHLRHPNQVSNEIESPTLAQLLGQNQQNSEHVQDRLRLPSLSIHGSTITRVPEALWNSSAISPTTTSSNASDRDQPLTFTASQSDADRNMNQLMSLVYEQWTHAPSGVIMEALIAASKATFGASTADYLYVAALHLLQENGVAAACPSFFAQYEHQMREALLRNWQSSGEVRNGSHAAQVTDDEREMSRARFERLQNPFQIAEDEINLRTKTADFVGLDYLHLLEHHSKLGDIASVSQLLQRIASLSLANEDALRDDKILREHAEIPLLLSFSASSSSTSSSFNNSKKFIGNECIVAALIRCFGAMNRPDLALEIFRRTTKNMQGKGIGYLDDTVISSSPSSSSLSSLSSYSSSSSPLSENLDSQSAQWVNHLLETMDLRDLIPSSLMLEAIAEVFAIARDESKLTQLLEDIIQHKSLPSVKICNLLMRIHIEKGNYAAAISVLDWMHSAGIQPTIAIFETLVLGAAKLGHTSSAYYFVRASEDGGWAVTSRMWCALLEVEQGSKSSTSSFRWVNPTSCTILHRILKAGARPWKAIPVDGNEH